MLGMMADERVSFTSDAAAPAESVLQPSDAKIEGVDGFAVRGDKKLDVMVWNYREEDLNAPARKIKLEIAGLPVACGKLEIQEFRVDDEYSNAYSAWQKMGRPQKPTAARIREVRRSGSAETSRSTYANN
jgi:xylan 1,4-beta-xylosidase